MKTGSLVTYKCYKNIKKINDIGVVLEIQQNLILKESIGFDYEDLLRIHWFTEICSDGVPSFKTDGSWRSTLSSRHAMIRFWRMSGIGHVKNCKNGKRRREK